MPVWKVNRARTNMLIFRRSGGQTREFLPLVPQSCAQTLGDPILIPMPTGDIAADRVAVLFKPFTIKNLVLSNRIVMAPMTRSKSPGGIPGPEVAAYYRRRAAGGVGLIVVGGADISDDACGLDSMLSIRDDKFLPGLARFAEAMRAEGSRTAIQLYHAGAYSFCAMKGVPTMAPSEYESYFTRQKTTAMTVEIYNASRITTLQRPNEPKRPGSTRWKSLRLPDT